MTLETEEDPNISFGGSQGSNGFDSMFSFEDEDLEALIGDWSDEELAALDINGDQIITWDEYNP